MSPCSGAELAGARAQAPARQRSAAEPDFKLVLALMRTNGLVSALVRAGALISERVEAVSLNALMLTNQALYACTRYTVPPDPEQGADPASYELRFRVSEHGVVVASSGWEQPSPLWELLAQGTVLEIRRHDLGVSVHRHPRRTAELVRGAGRSG